MRPGLCGPVPDGPRRVVLVESGTSGLVGHDASAAARHRGPGRTQMSQAALRRRSQVSTRQSSEAARATYTAS